MENKFDIIVIGAGSAGLSVSLFTAEAGLKTLLIDKAAHHIGGDCLNYGCVPSKALIHVSRYIQQAREATSFGMRVDGNADLQQVWKYIQERQQIIRKHENEDYLRKKGMQVKLGTAQFHSKNSILVNDEIYTGKKIILATGSKPSPLKIKGVEKVALYNNETIFNLKTLPERLLVIGGGPIGVEIGQAMHRLGAEVTIVHNKPAILSKEDSGISFILLHQLEKEGIQFFLNTSVEEFTNQHEVILKNADGKKSTLQFDVVFAATGRYLDLDGLHPEKAGIQTQGNKIFINSSLRTTNKDIFLCGDIAGMEKFSHAAEYHARIILNNLFSPLKKKTEKRMMSWVTFTDPQVATFGYQESELKKQSRKFTRIEFPFTGDDRAVTDDYQYGKLILYLTPGNIFGKQKILGGTMIAPNAGEMIQELILVSQQSLNTSVLFDKLYPYPTSSRVNQLSIVEQKQKALTSTMRKLLRILFRIQA